MHRIRCLTVGPHYGRRSAGTTRIVRKHRADSRVVRGRPKRRLAQPGMTRDGNLPHVNPAEPFRCVQKTLNRPGPERDRAGVQVDERAGTMSQDLARIIRRPRTVATDHHRVSARSQHLDRPSMGFRAAQHVVQPPVLDAKLGSAMNPRSRVERKVRTCEDTRRSGKSEACDQRGVDTALRSPERCIDDEDSCAVGRSHRDLDSLRQGSIQRAGFNFQFCRRGRQRPVDRAGQFPSPSFLPFLDRVGAVERFKLERSRERVLKREGRVQCAQPL